MSPSLLLDFSLHIFYVFLYYLLFFLSTLRIIPQHPPEDAESRNQKTCQTLHVVFSHDLKTVLSERYGRMLTTKLRKVID
jgi:hypothetical protein